MRDLSTPLSAAAPARWAARPARIATAIRLVPALIAFMPTLPILGIALLIDLFIPGDPYPQQAGLSGWIEPTYGRGE